MNLRPLELTSLPVNPLISVLVTNYNYGQYIAEAIESVLNQTYQNFEVVVCDDGSTDNSLEIIRRFVGLDARIRYVVKQNGGQASALNVAYANSRGQIVCLLDADDVFLPRKLEAILGVFNKQENPGLVIHRLRVVHGDTLAKGIDIPAFAAFERGFIADKVYSRGGRWTSMGGSALCFRRELADLLFPIDEQTFRSVADAYLYVLAPILARVDFIDEALVLYRLHGENLTGMGNMSADSVKKYLQTLKRVIHGVNVRLEKMGLPIISLEENLTYKEQAFLLCLLTRCPLRETLSRLLDFTKVMLRDDLYTPIPKSGKLLGFWLAILVPVRQRSAYLEALVYVHRLKKLLSRWRKLTLCS